MIFIYLCIEGKGLFLTFTIPYNLRKNYKKYTLNLRHGTV